MNNDIENKSKYSNFLTIVIIWSRYMIINRESLGIYNIFNTIFELLEYLKLDT